MDLIPVSEVRVGDVFSDIRVTVSHTEPLSEMLQVLDCYIEGYNGQQTMTMILPKEHQVRVYRL